MLYSRFLLLIHFLNSIHIEMYHINPKLLNYPFPQKCVFLFSFILFFFFFFLPCHATCGLLVPRPGIEPTPPVQKHSHLNHWPTRAILGVCILNFTMYCQTALQTVAPISLSISMTSWSLFEFALNL